jgi:hypothetical protein
MEEYDTIRAGDTKDDTMTTHGDETNKQQQQQDRKELDALRFGIGLGPNAIVREGVVLVAPPEEYNHYLMRSALFVYAMGLDELQRTSHSMCRTGQSHTIYIGRNGIGTKWYGTLWIIIVVVVVVVIPVVEQSDLSWWQSRR